MILKFDPNTPVSLTLTSAETSPATSKKDGKPQYIYRAQTAGGKSIFYASQVLNEKIQEALTAKKITIGSRIEICKRVAGDQTQWVVQAMANTAAKTVETNEAQNTQSLPAPAHAASVKPMPTAKAPEAMPAKSEAPAPGVREVARLYAECWLEVQNAMTALGTRGIKEQEDLRHAASAIFIEAARRQLKPNTARLKELLVITAPKPHQSKAA